jgi:hypothetical protein
MHATLAWRTALGVTPARPAPAALQATPWWSARIPNPVASPATTQTVAPVPATFKSALNAMWDTPSTRPPMDVVLAVQSTPSATPAHH